MEQLLFKSITLFTNYTTVQVQHRAAQFQQTHFSLKFHVQFVTQNENNNIRSSNKNTWESQSRISLASITELRM